MGDMSSKTSTPAATTQRSGNQGVGSAIPLDENDSDENVDEVSGLAHNYFGKQSIQSPATTPMYMNPNRYRPSTETRPTIDYKAINERSDQEFVRYRFLSNHGAAGPPIEKQIPRDCAPI